MKGKDGGAAKVLRREWKLHVLPRNGKTCAGRGDPSVRLDAPPGWKVAAGYARKREFSYAFYIYFAGCVL